MTKETDFDERYFIQYHHSLKNPLKLISPLTYAKPPPVRPKQVHDDCGDDKNFRRKIDFASMTLAQTLNEY
jgi:hypothetical protein